MESEHKKLHSAPLIDLLIWIIFNAKMQIVYGFLLLKYRYLLLFLAFYNSEFVYFV